MISRACGNPDMRPKSFFSEIKNVITAVHTLTDAGINFQDRLNM